MPKNHNPLSARGVQRRRTAPRLASAEAKQRSVEPSRARVAPTIAMASQSEKPGCAGISSYRRGMGRGTDDEQALSGGTLPIEGARFTYKQLSHPELALHARRTLDSPYAQNPEKFLAENILRILDEIDQSE